ncbi:MAG TPA: CDP-alcohol phosphatidyltransferase family protein [Spirochaetales bacterium]|nr:CDP-alcohol phosphatidyltransferase family protein [Spirochaetales bacterium]
MNNQYSMRAIWASLPAEKRKSDAYWTQWVLRPFSIPVSWIFLRLKVSANGVSYLSALTALVGGILLCIDSASARIGGALLLNLFAVLDCVDGNIARVTKTTGPWGAWADALGGYVAYASALLGAGMAAEMMCGGVSDSTGGILPAGAFAFLGGLAAGSNLLMRLVYQSYKNVRQEKASEDIAGEKRISENLGVTGMLMPAVLIGVCTGALPIVVAFYAVLYGGGCIVSIGKLIRKVERLKKKE